MTFRQMREHRLLFVAIIDNMRIYPTHQLYFLRYPYKQTHLLGKHIASIFSTKGGNMLPIRAFVYSVLYQKFPWHTFDT